MTKEEKIQKIREYAKEINSPLSIRDIGLLIEYGQCGEPHRFEDYMNIYLKWREINKE